MRTRAHVIICTYDRDPVTRRMRSMEVSTAIRILGCTHHEWQLSEAELSYEEGKSRLDAWNFMISGTVVEGGRGMLDAVPDRIYAPAVEPEGHEQHNLIGQLAVDLFGDRVTAYLTYAPRGQRSRDGEEVVPTPEEIACKLRALACYRTQIANQATRPWFFDLLDLREWHAR